VGLAHVGSIPTSGIRYWREQVCGSGERGRGDTPRDTPLFCSCTRSSPGLADRHSPRFRTQALLGAIAGIATGLLIGWVLWPVEYTQTTPVSLDQDSKDTYVSMVAEAFVVENSLENAKARIQALRSGEPDVLVSELLARRKASGVHGEETDCLIRLADALSETTKTGQAEERAE
jgi:hypothetical protein